MGELLAQRSPKVYFVRLLRCFAHHPVHRVCIVAVVPLPVHILTERQVTGSYVGSLREMRELMALVADGKIEPVDVESRDQLALEVFRGNKKVNGRPTDNHNTDDHGITQAFNPQGRFQQIAEQSDK